MTRTRALLTGEQEPAVEQLVRRAGAALLAFWPGAPKSDASKSAAAEHRPPDLGVEYKGDGSPVSQADYAANEILVSGLQQLFPNDSILSEEIPRDPSAKQSQRLWIIDPLDGTRSFLNGNDDFSVLVALCEGPRPMHGWLNFPARQTLAIASRGDGAQINGERAAVSTVSAIRPARVYVRNLTLARPELTYPEWLDSGCAMLMLASGEFDGVIIKLLTHREWDLAAPAVLIEEAGGRVSDEHGNAIAFDQGGMPCRYFVASNGIVHDELLQLIPEEDR